MGFGSAGVVGGVEGGPGPVFVFVGGAVLAVTLKQFAFAFAFAMMDLRGILRRKGTKEVGCNLRIHFHSNLDQNPRREAERDVGRGMNEGCRRNLLLHKP